MTPVTEAAHVPVLLDRVVALFAPAVVRGDGTPVVVDATLGLGGHAEAVLERFPDVHLIGIDRDPEALARSRERLAPHAPRTTLVEAVYDEVGEVVDDLTDGAGAAVVLFDLGVSSLQLDRADRGFSYAHDAPLDMRMGDSGTTAADILNTYDVDELTRVLRDWGEERFARRLARAMVRERDREPFTTSSRLVDLVRDNVPAATRRTGGHPAKRTFQALRIEVNDELRVLERALPAAIGALRPGGRVVSMAYQSLEDRLVKRAFAAVSSVDAPPGLPVRDADLVAPYRLVTRGAERADDAEVDENPRARPVRLRALERVHPDGPADERTDDSPDDPSDMTADPTDHGDGRR